MVSGNGSRSVRERRFPARGEIVGIRIEEKREREQWFGAVEEEHIAVTLDNRISCLAREIRDCACAGNVMTNTVRAVFPVVKWTLDGFTNHAAAAQIRAH